MRLRTLLLVSTTLLLAVTCDKKKEEPEPQPPVTPKIEIPSESQAVFSQGISIQAGTQTQSLTVKFTATAAWSADVADTKSSSWLSVQPTSGSAGAVTMTVTAQPNTTDKARSSTVTIQCGTVKQSFTVNQDAAVPQTIAVESVTLNKTELTLEPSGTETLIATVAPENATDKTVTWSTSNAEIATVADGKVTAVKEGEAIITAKAGEKQATCKVTVKKGVVAVTSVTLNKDKLDLRKGEDETLVATVAPDDATDKTVTWSSSDATIASVDETGKVTAVKSGKATITAAAGEKSAMCSVTVTTPVQSVSLDRTSVTLEVGQMTTLFATVSPNDADEKTVTWASSNVAVASIAGGVVTAMSEGTAVIKASAGGKEASCTVTVQKNVIAVTSVTLNKTTLSLTKGQSETLTATVAPDDATDKTVTWTSSNTKVATVENGTVKAVGDGTAVITAKAGEQSATCEVSVIIPVESVSLDVTSMTLKVGQKSSVLVKIQPLDATILEKAWSNTHPEVATVDMMDNIEAISVGQTVITVTIDGKSASCTITVEEQSVSVESVTLNKNILSLTKGQSETLTATVAPDNATDKTVTWSSSDATIASVDQTGKVTAVKSGKATITAAAGEKSATCEVTVTTPVQSVSLDRTTVSLEEGQTITLTATISPNDADVQTITWTTSNAAAATVTNGVVTAVAEGTAVIKASAGGEEASCTVTVQKKVIAVTEITLNKATLELKKGKSETLVATVAPDDATDKKVTWKTSNAGVATVVDGLVTAVEEGTAIIQASAGDKMARCEVAVTAYHISVSPTSLSFLSAGGSKDIKISCNGDWSISGQPSWCTPSATTGTGDATIQLTVSANNDAKRTGSLTITCSGMTKTVSITQIGSGWQNQRFVHKSLYMMFTSVHCGYSVGMNERIKLADEKVGDKYCRVDVHGRGMGNPLLESPIDFDEAPTLYGLFYGGIPSGVIDYRIRIRNWSDSDSHLVVENFVSAIAEQEKIYPAQTGVSFVSSISGSTLTVSGKVYSHVAEDFKISVYLLEDGIQGSSLGYTSEFYTSRQFDNVLRLSLSNVLGDEISFGTKNSVQEFKYSTTIPEGYNKDNLSILVIVQRGYADQIVREEYMGDYYVDNCRKAKVGTEARLEVYENASGGGNEGISIGDDITF